MLRTVVTGLDLRLQRQAGNDVPTPAPAAVPALVASPGSWDDCLKAWKVRNPGLAQEAFFSMQTAWRSLRAFAQARGIPGPGLVSRDVVEVWATHRHFTEGRAGKTVNEQRRKLRLVFVAAVKAKLVDANPVVDIEVFKTPRRSKSMDGRLPFSDVDLQAWFSHPIFTQHLRSASQAGESSYWLPLLMFYTGARPEELAGLDVSDARHSKAHGPYAPARSSSSSSAAS